MKNLLLRTLGIIVMMCILSSATFAADESDTTATATLDKIIRYPEGTEPPSADLSGTAMTQLAVKAFINKKGLYSSDMAYVCKPGDTLDIQIDTSEYASTLSEITLLPIETPGAKHAYEIRSDRRLKCEHTVGILLKVLENGIVWKSPQQPGNTRLVIHYSENRTFTDLAKNNEARNIGSIEDTFVLNVLVQFPFEENSGQIENYALGLYPDQNSSRAPSVVQSHREMYRPPSHFIKVTPEVEHLYLNRHYQVGDFSPVSERGKNHFTALDPDLLRVLEAINDTLVAKGHKIDHVKIIRAFISPMKRTLLRREGVSLSTFTRFQYGDALAIIVDEDNDGIMDDLNGDGERDFRDADLAERIVDDVMRDLGKRGGHGVFSNLEDPDHPDTPYVQFDLRGINTPFRYVSVSGSE